MISAIELKPPVIPSMANRKRKLKDARKRPIKRAAKLNSKPGTFISVKKSHDAPRKKLIKAKTSTQAPPYTNGIISITKRMICSTVTIKKIVTTPIQMVARPAGIQPKRATYKLLIRSPPNTTRKGNINNTAKGYID